MKTRVMNKRDSYPFDFEQEACEGCGGKCCGGESGYVFVSIDEMHAIALYLHMEFDDFTRTYVRRVGNRFSLIEVVEHTKTCKKSEFECVFLKHGLCSIYEVRPAQCRNYPFWEGHRNLDRENLMRLMQECRGVKAK